MGMVAKWVVTKKSSSTPDQQVAKAKAYIEQVQGTIANDQGTAIQYDDNTNRLLMVFSDKATKDFGLDTSFRVLADYDGLMGEINKIKSIVSSIPKYDDTAILQSIKSLSDRVTVLENVKPISSSVSTGSAVDMAIGFTF